MKSGEARLRQFVLGRVLADGDLKMVAAVMEEGFVCMMTCCNGGCRRICYRGDCYVSKVEKASDGDAEHEGMQDMYDTRKAGRACK